MRMKLTVAIVYCDKDKQYVPGLIRNIEDCVKFPHEIVLVDNTTEGDRVGEGRYFWMGGNRSAAQGRKKASELAEGDYIWFVDADDEVFPLEEPDGNFDMYVYGYEIFSGKDDLFRAEPEGDYVIEGEWLFNRTTYDYLGQTLWNKIIRLSVVSEVESMIPLTWTSRPGEDILLYAACYVRSRSVAFRKPVIYRYRADRSVATNPSMTPEMFRAVLYGCKESHDLGVRLLKGFDRKLGFDTDYVQDIRYYLGRIRNAADERSGKIMMEELMDYFGKDKVLSIAEKEYPDLGRLYSDTAFHNMSSVYSGEGTGGNSR